MIITLFSSIPFYPPDSQHVEAHELTHIKNRDMLIGSIAATLAGAIVMLANMAQWAAMFGGVSRDNDDEGGGGVIGAGGGSNHSPAPPPDGAKPALGGEAQGSGHAPPAPDGAVTADASGGGAVAAADSRPPSDPASASRQSQGRPGQFGRTSIPHAVGWTVGTWAGATHRTVSSAFRSSQKEGEEF